MELRPLRADEGMLIKRVRLRSLEDAPHAFGEGSLEEESAFPDSYWHQLASEVGGESAKWRDRCVSFVVLDGDEPCGTATCYLCPRVERRAWFVAAWIDPRHRRKGLGRRMVDASLEWAAAHGADHLRLWVDDTNPAALEFYRALGFEATGESQPVSPGSPVMQAELERRLDGSHRGDADSSSPSSPCGGPGVPLDSRSEAQTIGASRPSAAGDASDAADVPSISGFRIVEVIGRGGMGVVYRAWQEGVGRFVALKVLAPWLLGDASALARFRREVAILARCDHPNVVRVLASGPDATPPWFAMELLEGSDIATFAAGRAEPSERGAFRRIAALVRDAARGLHHLHELGVVHRDVKPANLLVTLREQRVVVTDLGIASVSDPALPTVRTQGFVGTLRYVAPEQLTRPADEIDRRADVRALGAVLHELLTGRPFLDAPTDTELLQQVLHARPSSPRETNPAVPVDLDLVATKAVAIAPALRHATADALAADLDAFLDGRPVAARPPTLGYVLRLAMRRHRALAAALMALVVLAVGGAVAFTLQRQQALVAERALRRDAEEARSRLDTELRRTRSLAIAQASADALSRGDVTLALLLGQEAVALSDDVPARQALRDAVQHPVHALATLPGHDAALTGVRFRPDGQAVLTSSKDGTARWWDLSGREMGVLGRPGDPPVNAVAIGPSGDVALAREDGSVLVGEADGPLLPAWPASGHPMALVEFSPDGRTLAAFSGSGVVHLLDRTTGRRLELAGHAPWSAPTVLAFSRDGSFLVTASGDAVARAWRLPGGEGIELRGHQGRVWDAAISSDSRLIATVAFDDTPIVWDVRGRVVARLASHDTREVSAVAFSPDGRRIATGGTDGTIRVWTTDGRQVEVMHDPGSAPTGLRYSPDGRILLGSFRDGSIRAWDAGGALLALTRDLATREEYGGYEDIVDARFSPDGRLVATASLDGTGRIWSVSRLEQFRRAWQHATVVPAHDAAVVADLSGDVRLLGGDGTAGPALGHHDDEVWCAAMSPDGRLVATGSRDGVLLLVDRGGARLAELRLPQTVLDVEFSADGSLLAVACRDGAARVIDAAGRVLGLVRHEQAVRAVAFLGSGVLTASLDGTAALSSADGRRLASFVGHEAPLRDVVPSPSGRVVATCAADGTARLWSPDGTPLAVMRGHEGRLHSIAFSPDEALLVTGGDDRTARTWSLDGSGHAILRGHDRAVMHAEFSPDGSLVATASADGTARLWSREGAPSAVLRGHSQWAWTARFSPDGRRLTTTAEDGTVRSWIVRDADILAAARRLAVRGFSPAELRVHGPLIGSRPGAGNRR